MKVIDLGLIEYSDAESLQKKIHQEVYLNKQDDTLLLCEHYPVITKGRTSHLENILASKDLLRAKGIGLADTDRGGDVTIHLIGQLVVYPIVNLKRFKPDIRWFLRTLEDIIINLLNYYQINAARIEGFRGVWVGSKKIASIGIAVRHWITYHGIALNVNCDLDKFSLIRPCGLNIKMTSISQILRRNIDMSEIKQKIIEIFQDTFIDAKIIFKARLLPFSATVSQCIMYGDEKTAITSKNQRQ